VDPEGELGGDGDKADGHGGAEDAGRGGAGEDSGVVQEGAA